MRGIILASLWALLSTVPQQAPTRDRPARDGGDVPRAAATATISGRVYSAASGTPLQGALVVLVPAPAVDSSTIPPLRSGAARSGSVTDALGQFRITGVAPGVYRMVANPAGYTGRYLAAGHAAPRANDAGKRITIATGADIRNADIALPNAVAIEGRVTDQSGEPLARISMFAARVMLGASSPQRALHPPALTDDLGRYRIYGLEPGTYVVGATGQLLMSLSDDAFGMMNFAPLTQWEPQPFITTFHPSSLAEGSAQRIGLGMQDATGIDIMLLRSRRFKLSGMVVDSQGQPAASLTGVLMRPGVHTVDHSTLRTDPQGRFSFGALDPGDYRILIGSGMAPRLTSVNGRAEFADLPISVAADTSDMVVVTQPAIGIAGRIVFAEGVPSPVPEMRIEFRRQDPARQGDIVATFGDELRFFGSDVFGPLLVRVTSPPKGWVVKAVTLDGADITDVPTVFRREDDGQLQLVLSSRPASIEGEVRGESGPATDEATVYVFSEDRRSWSLSSPRTVFSDMGEKGRFSVGGLSGGRYYAIAIARDGFRIPPKPGEAFFEVLSKDATPFVIGDDERRTLDLRLWRWPE